MPDFRESSRLAAVQPPVIPIIAELIRRHPGTISLGQGVVHYGPPAEHVARRLSEFSREPENHKYQAVHGIGPLVAALEAKLLREHGVAVGADRRVVVTAGGNMAFASAVLAVADVGDEVILPTPFYFNHEMAVTIAGCRPVRVATDPVTFQLDVGAIEAAITPRTRAAVTISPNNPTGVVYPERAIRAVNDLCRARGVFHIHDEAYEYFTWNGAKHFSPASIAGAESHTVCLHSLSKSYGFASWRIGSMLIPAGLFDAVRKVQDTILICPPVVSQYAALGALDAGPAYVREHLAGIGEVRDIVLGELTSLGGDRVQLAAANGAFYAFLRVRPRERMTSMQLVERLVRDHGVAVIPGTTFGIDDADGTCTIRASYGSLRKESVLEGVGRLVRGLRAIAQDVRMRVACCQFDIAWEDKPANYARVERLVNDAALPTGTVLLLPEMFATGFSMNAAAIAERPDGETAQFVAGLARDRRLYVIAGVVLGDAAGGRPRNEAMAFDPSGALLCRYAKVHRFSFAGEDEHYAAGSAPASFAVGALRVQPTVCYDLRFPELFRDVRVRGAELICVIANWPAARDEHWMALLKARAIENQAYVAAVNRCGRDPNVEYSGRSQVVSPWGEVLADARGEETVIQADLDLDRLREYRRKFPALNDVRL